MTVLQPVVEAPRFSGAQRGVAYNITAHLFWGAMALYFSVMTHIPAMEIAAHRGIWSLPLAVAIVSWFGQWRDVFAALRSARTMLILLLTSSIIVFNWGVYIWSIENGRALESSLGYFINPLLNVIAGYVFLGERFSKPQVFAFGIAALGIAVQTITTGAFPWVGLLLGATFCIYGLLRKLVSVGATQGFFIEILFMVFPLLLLEFWILKSGQGKFGGALQDTLMLAGTGALTTGALVFFSSSLKLIRYSTAGMLQYISPSIVFLTAIFVLKEPMNFAKLVSFALIWLALAIYTWSMLQAERQTKVTVGAGANQV